jgi:hypothetical protein
MFRSVLKSLVLLLTLINCSNPIQGNKLPVALNCIATLEEFVFLDLLEANERLEFEENVYENSEVFTLKNEYGLFSFYYTEDTIIRKGGGNCVSGDALFVLDRGRNIISEFIGIVTDYRMNEVAHLQFEKNHSIEKYPYEKIIDSTIIMRFYTVKPLRIFHVKQVNGSCVFIYQDTEGGLSNTYTLNFNQFDKLTSLSCLFLNVDYFISDWLISKNSSRIDVMNSLSETETDQMVDFCANHYSKRTTKNR